MHMANLDRVITGAANKIYLAEIAKATQAMLLSLGFRHRESNVTRLIDPCRWAVYR
jgi:hypothetical protein